MSSIYGYSKEAVRIKVKKCNAGQPPESRKFSVDPQITSFEVLHSILVKAFDLKNDFSICYKVHDTNGYETSLPLLSDWDLDAAFVKAHNMSVILNTEPCLCLQIDVRSIEECPDESTIKRNFTFMTQIKGAGNQESRPARLHGIINQVGKTFNMVQRAFNFGEDDSASLQQPPRPPLSDTEFRRFLDPVGQIIFAKELRSVIYYGGIEPSLRKVVWKHLLNVYPEGMTGKERMDYIKKKAVEYTNLRDTWKAAISKGSVTGELAYTTGMVRKDVLRTDRHHPFYAGSDDNQNVASLFNILTTYALNHPKVSYCQGMSDLASPLLVTMNDEAHAYVCFCALMNRLCTNFMIDGIAMTQKFTHLAEGLMHYDPEFYNYLRMHEADDLLFCYRWLLLEMKREFAFEDSLRMLEVLWSSLPADPPDKELRLFDVPFKPPPSPSTPPPLSTSPHMRTQRETAYTKICALRRQSSSISLNSYQQRKSAEQGAWRQIHSLDDSMSKSKTLPGITLKHLSLDDAVLNESKEGKSSHAYDQQSRAVPKHKPGSPLEKTPEVQNNRVNLFHVTRRNGRLSASLTNLLKTTKGGHFKELRERIAASKLSSSLNQLDTPQTIEEEKPIGKKIKNLNEFLNFGNIRIRQEEDKTRNNIRSNTRSTLGSDRSRISSNSDDRFSLNSYDDTLDESSPEDSQDQSSFATSITNELKLELENLDRKVFGDKYVEKEKLSRSAEINSRSDEVFLWENPLLPKDSMKTPDEVFGSFTKEPSKDTDEDIGLPISNAGPVLLNNTLTAVTAASASHMTNSCEEVTESIKASTHLPPPNEFGGGNPFLMFLCITLLMQHRDHIISKAMDYNEMAMHFDKMVRKHNVVRVLNQARQMYARVHQAAYSCSPKRE
nr:unnamed protein product [Callosobruchus analis]